MVSSAISCPMKGTHVSVCSNLNKNEGLNVFFLNTYSLEHRTPGVELNPIILEVYDFALLETLLYRLCGQKLAHLGLHLCPPELSYPLYPNTSIETVIILHAANLQTILGNYSLQGSIFILPHINKMNLHKKRTDDATFLRRLADGISMDGGADSYVAHTNYYVYMPCISQGEKKKKKNKRLANGPRDTRCLGS